jgi:hypothetical protein
MSENCRFSVVLGDGNVPVGGVALPTVAVRVLETLKAIGAPQMIEEEAFPGWHMVPSLFLDFDHMTGRERMDPSLRLSAEIHDDQDSLRKIVTFVHLAGEKIRECAGTVRDALDFARNAASPHPQYAFVIPVGYRLIGLTGDADAYVAETLTRLHDHTNPELTKHYERFASELAKAAW